MFAHAKIFAEHHPAYKNLIDWAVIQNLPAHHIMTDRVHVHPLERSESREVVATNNPIRVAVPNLLAREFLKDAPFPVANGSYLVPVRELNRTRPYLSLAFPSLYPFGLGEYVVPRQKTVPFKDYVVHFLRHEDRSFAKHISWLPITYCMLLNAQINSKSHWLGTKGLPDKLTDEQLEVALTNEDSTLMREVYDHGATMRSTRPWWNAKRKELYAMIRALGQPNLFLTLTANVLEWTSLLEMLPGYSPRFSSDQLQELADQNPDIVVEYFVRRRDLFFKHVVTDRFDVEDIWGRFEFQGNGNIHWHGVLWCRGAPVPTTKTLADTGRLTDFWEQHVVANLPIVPESTQNVHEQVKDLRNLVRSYQQHDCANSPKCTREQCQYRYPRINQGSATIVNNGSFEEFLAKRNHPLTVAYNALLLIVWRGNLDIQVLTGYWWVFIYITKYLPYDSDIFTRELQRCATACSNTMNPMVAKVQTILENLIGQREYSMQEICHNLLDLPLVTSSREVVQVDTRPNLVDHARSSIVVKYVNRNQQTLATETLIDFILKRDLRHSDRTLRRSRVPRYVPLPTTDEARARWQVTLFHAFQNNPLDYLRLNRFPDWKTAHEDCISAGHQHETPSYILDIPDPVNLTDAEPDTLNDWRSFVRSVREKYSTPRFGTRDMDTNADYSSMINSVEGINKFWSLAEPTPVDLNLPSLQEDASKILNTEQYGLYKDAMDVMADILDGKDVRPFLTQVDGGPGTGKSFVCEMVVDHVECMAELKGKPHPAVKIIAPTGVAAKHVNGETIHAALRINPAGFLALEQGSVKRLFDDNW